MKTKWRFLQTQLKDVHSIPVICAVAVCSVSSMDGGTHLIHDAPFV